MQRIAKNGTAGHAGPLPYLGRIQQSFGPGHHLGQVKAYVGGRAAAAARSLEAEAYAVGDSVAFGTAPSLRTAAHEAAHVVQQRHGVQLQGGVGRPGDAYERNADAVADRVVRGESAQELLYSFPPAGAGASSSAVQRQPRLEGQVDLFDEEVLGRVAGRDRGENEGDAGGGERESAAARQDFDSLPGPLKEVLQKSFDWPDAFWAGLEPRQKTGLSEAYNRLSALGLWKHVARIRGEHDKPERKAFGGRAMVAGSAGGIGFEAHDATALEMGLFETGKFGLDPWWAALLHRGQDSFREFNTEDGSLHISVGPGNHFDTHIDQVGAVNKPEGNKGKFDPERSIKHHTREVWPEFIRKGTGIPGVIVGAGPTLSDIRNEPGPYDDKVPPTPFKGENDILGSVNIVAHPIPKEKPRSVAHAGPEAGTARVDPEVMARAEAAGAGAATAYDLMPNPVGSDPDDFADPATIASSLAGRITKAARDGRLTAELDLGSNYSKATAAERKSIAEAVGRIGVAVAAQLPQETHEVRSLRVHFGDAKGVEYVSLRR
ncbi:MAG TPA: DUF4157 domain-containing protein [Pyrinomonadaceae bacterium]|jgi:hypothetical protein|nr:DUF4157 domain-containing protein [Pyrinomonadaceae bacterium]